MCSYIVEKAKLIGTAKGPNTAWMKVDTANADGGRERVAIEISRQSALDLMEAIKAALASGDASHVKAQACSLVGSQTEVASLF
jgi:hypothetical protein